MPSRRSARPVRLVLASAALVGFVAVVALVLLALPFRGAPASAEAAKDDLTEAASALRSGEVEAASALTESARGHVDDLQADVQGVGGDVWSWVPVAGGPVRDVRRLANALDELTTVAEVGVQTWPEVTGEETGLVDDGNVDLDRLAELTDRVGDLHDHLEAAQSELQEVGDSRIGVGTRLADARDEALAEVDPVDAALDRVEDMVDVLPRMLGGQDDRKYVVAMLNPAEMLYSGGTAQSFTTLAVSDGKLTLGETIDYPTAPWLGEDRYWRKVERNPFHRGRIRVPLATMAPDWSVAGNELANAWRSARGRRMAGVIAVDVVALSRLVGLTGPVELPGFGRLTPDNMVKALVGSYDRYSDNAERHELNRALGDTFADQLLSANPIETGKVLAQAAEERHFAVYFRDEEEQAVFDDLGVTGRLAELDRDYLGVFTQTQVGTKSDFWQRRALDADVRVAEDGSAKVRLAVTIHNDSPPYVRPEPDPRTGYWTRWNSLSILTMLPEGSVIHRGTVDGEPFPIQRGNFYGRAYQRHNVEFAPQARHTLVIHYTVPKVATDDGAGGLEYALDVDPQGMVDPADLDVTVTFPAGWSVDELPTGWTSPQSRVARFRTDALTASESFEVTASP